MFPFNLHIFGSECYAGKNSEVWRKFPSSSSSCPARIWAMKASESFSRRLEESQELIESDSGRNVGQLGQDVEAKRVNDPFTLSFRRAVTYRSSFCLFMGCFVDCLAGFLDNLDELDTASSYFFKYCWPD